MQYPHDPIATGEMPSPRHALSARTIREPEEASGLLPGVAFDVFPLGGGPFEVSVTTLQLDGLVLQFGRSSPHIGFVRVQPGLAAIQVPLSHAESLVPNGRACGPRLIGAHGEGAQLLRVNTRPAAHAVLILPVAEAAALVPAAGVAGLFRPCSVTCLDADDRAWDSAIGALRGVIAAAPGALDGNERQDAAREMLLRAARRLLEDAVPQAPPRGARCADRRQRLVIAADGYLRAHVDRPVYTEELCRALGVSPSALAEAFRATLSISPHRFLKLRRLGMVRAALRDRTAPAPMVKAVALSHGFWHLSQFAQDYRAVFGETPSDTLARTRGRRPGNDADRAVPLALAG